MCLNSDRKNTIMEDTTMKQAVQSYTVTKAMYQCMRHICQTLLFTYRTPVQWYSLPSRCRTIGLNIVLPNPDICTFICMYILNKNSKKYCNSTVAFLCYTKSHSSEQTIPINKGIHA